MLGERGQQAKRGTKQREPFPEKDGKFQFYLKKPYELWSLFENTH